MYTLIYFYTYIDILKDEVKRSDGRCLHLSAGFDQIAIEGDVGVKVIAEDGVLALALEEPHPHLIILPQFQHQTLTLHNAAVTWLGIKDDHLLLIPHHVQVGLLLVPGVHIDVEEINASHIAVEFAREHVKVAIEVHQLSVKD